MPGTKVSMRSKNSHAISYFIGLSKVTLLALLMLVLTLNLITSEAVSAKEKKGAKKMNMKPVVLIETSLGNIELELDRERAPISTENFLAYVDKGFYDKTIFHRVINGFMVQGGGMTEDMKQKKTEAPIQNEAKNGLKNDNYTVAMARTNDTNSATAQFFINVADNGFLNHQNDRQFGYAVFGRVSSGKEIVDKIKTVATATHQGHENVPTTAVVIKSAKRKD